MIVEAQVRVACVQMRSGIDPAQNVEVAADLIRAAAADGAKLVATPEMTIALDRNSERLRKNLNAWGNARENSIFAELAEALSIHLLIGSSPVPIADGRIANRACLFGAEGEIVATYDKIHMFDVSLPNGESWRESAIYAPGERGVIARTPLGLAGLTICYDVRFPVLFRRLAQAGAVAFFVPAAFTRQTGEAHWSTLLRARAIENGAFVIAPGQGGRHEDGRETYGHSMIIDPWGQVLAELDNDEPGYIVADLSPAAALDARGRIPSLGLDRAAEVDILGR
ncbi:MAG: carbon-nitrogen hydrolase family protein [Alphaproteobacteria bacterium]|nr:carbon-nitrogen hydrolase family protein [Alphaproteobacteria bacterium]